MANNSSSVLRLMRKRDGRGSEEAVEEDSIFVLSTVLDTADGGTA
jgi:hypothetical protein